MEEQNLAEDNLLNFMNSYYVMKASGYFYLFNFIFAIQLK